MPFAGAQREPGAIAYRESGARLSLDFRVRSLACALRRANWRAGVATLLQRWSVASRVAICSTSSTMLRRTLASVIRVNARVNDSPSDVARKSEM